MGDLYFGTSGWSYKEWVGPFYEGKGKQFTYYSKFFQSVEINSTFYRYPSRSMVYGWFRFSPEGFKFSAKLPKLITHEKRLSLDQKVENDLLLFLELMNPLRLNRKLGAILIQLPPKFVFKRDFDALTSFLGVLPKEFRFAIEFRDASWLKDETWRLLEKNNVAYTIVDEPLLPPEVKVTADFAYFRWHGRGERPWYDYHYSREELESWVPRVSQVSEKVESVYGYFNNHFHGYAPENCVEILEMLNVATPEQSGIKERIVQYNLEARPRTYERMLKEFGLGKVYELGLEELLLSLIGEARLGRAEKIRDSELSFTEVSERRVKAYIREYIIEIDLEGRTIRHDCDDWRKRLGMKGVCKHLGKLFLKLPQDHSIRILRDIYEDKSRWKFEFIVR